MNNSFSPFQVMGDDINAMNDTDLRILVGLLCEAELQLQKIPTAGVTYGGSQTAPDGGIDVRVKVSCAVNPDGFIPRSNTGYQVKKSDMQPAMIAKEMRPKGELRLLICDLANINGAYIIVSAAANTADKALFKERITAMFDALDIPNASNLKLDFYDRNRVATWVNCHPSLVLWVKGKIGRSVQGWQPFANWANTTAEADEEYFFDDDIRLHNGDSQNSDSMKAIDGINALRIALSSPRASVRLTGLSGVGKTRLVQALFDERIGLQPLPCSQVCYTDMSHSHSPNPAPVAFAEQLRTLNKPVLLVVDNCPSELHKNLTSICAASGSLLSLITVEYDVRDDQPEETEVFRLEPASPALVERIIALRFKHISHVDARTIAEFSGGNGRIAIALAQTVGKGETIATLKNEDLFKRLFHQRHDANDNLMKSAEVCALVYSFDCQTAAGLNTELTLLASLAHISVEQLFRDLAELKRRDLTQQRNIWRAVLPHALANRLAKRALENIPLNAIRAAFERGDSARLLQSFSRRLSYLHDSPQAVEIAESWLSEQGFLYDVSNLNQVGIALLKNIAPIAPQATIATLERAANGENGQHFTSRDNRYFIEFTRLLRSLAYDPDLFERCVTLLCRFALTEKPTENSNSILSLLKSLFQLFRSGTHATAEQRLSIIETLFYTEHESEHALGLSLLGAALEAWHFSSHCDFNFGALSRDYGYTPETEEAVTQWFKLYIEFATKLIISNHLVADQVEKLLAEKFRRLWIKGGAFDTLEQTAKAIIDQTAWCDGWLAVRTTINFDAEQMRPDLLARLQALEKLLRPRNLFEQASAYAFSDAHSSHNLPEVDEEAEYQQLDQKRQQIGSEVAVDETVFNKLLPDLVTLDVNGAGLCSFATGLAKGCVDPLAMWQKFRHQLSIVDASHRNDTVLYCFLSTIAQTHPEIAEKILTEAVSDEILGVYFPHLQTAVKIDATGLIRLKQSLDNNLAPVRMYHHLADSRVYNSINNEDLCDLLRLLTSKTDGLAVAFDILEMRLNPHYPASEVIKSLAQECLAQVEFDCNTKYSEQMDYKLSIIADACLAGEQAADTAMLLCEKLAKAFAEYKIYSGDFTRLLNTLVKQQPWVFLDSFIGNNYGSTFVQKRLFTDYNSPKLLSHIANANIIAWCEVEPVSRYPKVATAIVAYQLNAEKDGLEWTALSFSIMTKAPDVVAVLSCFIENFQPMIVTGRGGARANLMERQLVLISQLKTHENSIISKWACDEEKVFAEDIKRERQSENERNRIWDERFE